MSWTQSQALLLAPYSINVNAICPGSLWTPMYERLAQHQTKFGHDRSQQGFTGREYFDMKVVSDIPLKREQTPEDIGKLAAFLVSEDARNITGQAINVGGGGQMN